jgi:hypothetical protein
MKITFSAAIFTGGPVRLAMTAKSINSLNQQTYPHIQKILVNGDGNNSKINELVSEGVNLEGWDIIDFPIDTFVRKEFYSLHRWPGQAALLRSTGDFFYTMNDDDFLANDFFYRMANLFEKYPEAVTGIGLPASYLHETDEYIFLKNRSGDWNNRPEYESGLDLYRKSYAEIEQYYNPNIGFQFVSKTSMVRDVATTFFSTGGFPNFSWQYVAARGGTVFDPKALMYWGRHSGEEHNDKDFDHCYHGIYKILWKDFVKSNDAFFDKYFPNSTKDKKILKRYFERLFVQYSVSMLLDFLSLGKRLRREKVSYKFQEKEQEANLRFPVFLHLGILAKRPLTTISYLQRALRTSLLLSTGKLPEEEKWT